MWGIIFNSFINEGFLKEDYTWLIWEIGHCDWNQFLREKMVWDVAGNLARAHSCNCSVQSISHVWLFATPWIAQSCPTLRDQASLFIINSRSSLKLTSIESVMPSSHLIFRCPLLLLPPIPPSIKVFSKESTLASFLPKNTQDWSPWKWTSWISLQSKGLSRDFFSNTTVQKHPFFGTQLSSQSNSQIYTWPLYGCNCRNV